MIIFLFINFNELNSFNEIFVKLNDLEDQGGMSGLMSGSVFIGSEMFWDLSGCIFICKVIIFDFDELIEVMGGEEMMDMVKMMMVEVSFIIIYYMLGCIKKCSIFNVEVDGKNVVVFYNFFDMLEEIFEIGGIIKFKKN